MQYTSTLGVLTRATKHFHTVLTGLLVLFVPLRRILMHVHMHIQDWVIGVLFGDWVWLDASKALKSVCVRMYWHGSMKESERELQSISTGFNITAAVMLWF